MLVKLIKITGILLLMTASIVAPPPEPALAAITMNGADVSTLQRAEDLGAKFYYANGTQGEALQILKDNGINYIRLRIWVNPANGYNNKTKVLAFAQKVKAKGLKLMIDFHYSDTWADPGKQFKPAVWASHNISQLQTDVYNYTLDVCNSLKAQGTTPDSVQVGNEINQGMLWPEGRVVNNNFTNLGLLLKQGYNAVKACNSATQVIIHIANAGDNAGARWFFDGIRAQGVNWDITALSYYSYWHGTMAAMRSSVADVKARYGKPVILAETAYAFTLANADGETNVINASSQLTSGYPATNTGQTNNYRDVKSNADAGGAIGVFYWEPTWIATPGNGWDPANPNSGNGWDNQALFSWTGVANPAIGLGGGGGGGVGAGTYDDQHAAFVYNGSGWGHGSGGGSNATCYNNSNSWNKTTNQYVTVTFNGTRIRFYGVRDPKHGIGAVSIDGGAETNVNFYAATRAGNQLLWTSPTLANGTHTFRLRVTGTKSSSATDYFVAPDRVDVE
jgi:arabinogalactan endo-1,4-beta-galactosidase